MLKASTAICKDRQLPDLLGGGIAVPGRRSRMGPDAATRRRRTLSDSPAEERGLMVDQQSLILSLRDVRPVQFLPPV
jgi:hypothetical protein